MLFAKLRHVHYWTVKESVEQYGSRYLLLRYTCELLLFLYCFARTVLLICGCLFEKQFASYRHLDYLSSVFSSKSARLNEQTAFMYSMVVLFNFLAKSNTYKAGAPEKTVFKKFYLYLVKNAEAFKEATYSRRKVVRIKRRLYRQCLNQYSNRIWRLFPPLLSLFCTLKVATQVAVELKSINLQALKVRPLSSYIEITFKMRIKMYWLVRLAESIAYAFGVLVYSLVILASFRILSHYRVLILGNWLYLAWILCDLLCVLYQFVTLYQMGFFYAFVSLFSVPLHSDKLNRDLAKLVTLRGKGSPAQAHIVQHFLDGYHVLLMDIIRGNNELWDRTMTIFLITNLVPNILLWTMLVFNDLSPMDRLLFVIIVIGQSFATVNSLLTCATNSEIHHRPAPKLAAVQGAIGRPLLRYKLKLDDVFKRLTRGAKYGVTVKPLGTISYHNLAEGLFCYVGFLIYSFNYRINKTFL